MTTPTHEEIKAHFANAKEIKCLNFKVIVNINHVDSFTLTEKGDAYYAGKRLIMAWNSVEGYAEITKLKCNKKDCKECNCNQNETT